MPISIADILHRLGGNDAAAALTGVSPEAVRKWRSGNAIPSRHWPAIMAATGLSMEELIGTSAPAETPPGATACLVLGDGSVFWGRGFGAHGTSQAAELCFSTGMTGYQETLTDPSFAGQIITFTFPHIGNVGTNDGGRGGGQYFRPRPGGQGGHHRAVQLPLDRAAACLAAKT